MESCSRLVEAYVYNLIKEVMNSNKNKHMNDNDVIEEEITSKILEIIKVNPNATRKQIVMFLNK